LTARFSVKHDCTGMGHVRYAHPATRSAAVQTLSETAQTAVRPRRTGRLRAAIVTVALLAGGLVLGAGPAAAFGTQDRVNSGVGAADQRGTAVGITWIDRITGEYRENGPAAHTGVGSASIVKLFIADDILYRNALSPNDKDQFNLMLGPPTTTPPTTSGPSAAAPTSSGVSPPATTCAKSPHPSTPDSGG